MTLMKRFVLFTLLCLSSSAYSSIALYEHAQAVGQAMSALYMQGLSEGNEKYERELTFYKQKANETLAVFVKENPEQGNSLQKKWDKLKNNISISYSSDFGWDVDASVRRDLRTYQGDIYQLSLTHNKQSDNKQEKYQFALLQLESVIARFFDIASVYDGTFSLSHGDLERLDPKVISGNFKAALDQLASNTTNDTLVQNIQSAKFKWEFIEESVINYSDQSAYFLVYATKKKIKKVLDSGMNQLSNNE